MKKKFWILDDAHIVDAPDMPAIFSDKAAAKFKHAALEEQPGEGAQPPPEDMELPDQGGGDPESIHKGEGLTDAIQIGEEKEVPDSVIDMLIERFLNEQFMPNDTDLNVRTSSRKKSKGYIKWDFHAVVLHELTGEYDKMHRDKYGYEKGEGDGEDIPLSFYFDLSGSMARFSKLLSRMAIKMLQRGVKVMLGFNETIYYQIDSVPRSFTSDDFGLLMRSILKYYGVIDEGPCRGAKMQLIKLHIDDYLKQKKAQKAVVFTDFDAKPTVEKLSKFCETWWFCFERREYYADITLQNFHGHFYNTEGVNELAEHLHNIGSKIYERNQRSMRERGAASHIHYNVREQTDDPVFYQQKRTLRYRLEIQNHTAQP